MPRPINRKTTLGAARALLGISTQQLEKRSRVAVSTIEKIESGRLPMTLEVARKISWATALHPRWLMGGDPEAKPMSLLNSPWTRESGAQIRKWKTQMNDADRKGAFDCCNQFLGLLSETLFPKAIKDGKIWDLLIDLDIAVTDIGNIYYPGVFPQEWPNESTPPQKPQSSRIARRKQKA